MVSMAQQNLTGRTLSGREDGRKKEGNAKKLGQQKVIRKGGGILILGKRSRKNKVKTHAGLIGRGRPYKKTGRPKNKGANAKTWKGKKKTRIFQQRGKQIYLGKKNPANRVFGGRWNGRKAKGNQTRVGGSFPFKKKKRQTGKGGGGLFFTKVTVAINQPH